MIRPAVAGEFKLIGQMDPICQLPFGVDEARRRFGWRFEPDEILLGNQWLLLVCDGRPVVVEGLDPAAVAKDDLQAGHLNVSIDAHWPDSSEAFARILKALNLTLADIPWISDGLGRRSWQVTRLDDNGNLHVIAYAGSQEGAEWIAKRFRAGGHKQSFDVVPNVPA